MAFVSFYVKVFEELPDFLKTEECVFIDCWKILKIIFVHLDTLNVLGFHNEQLNTLPSEISNRFRLELQHQLLMALPMLVGNREDQAFRLIACERKREVRDFNDILQVDARPLKRFVIG